MRMVLEEIGAWLGAFVQNMPGRIGRRMRYWYWRGRMQSCGSFAMGHNCSLTGAENMRLGRGINISHNTCLHANDGGNLILGDRVSINVNVFLGASNGGAITIGDDVLIGPNVVFRASNHQYKDKATPINRQGHQPGQIIVEDDVWIGANAVILDKAVIRQGAVIAAGAVVNSEIPAFSLAGGAPAKVIQSQFRQ